LLSPYLNQIVRTGFRRAFHHLTDQRKRAIELFGPAYHLPPPISGTNSAWLRGYPPSQPTTVIVVGDGDRDRQFTNCKLARTIPYPENQNNEESRDHADIYVCGPPRLPWPELWKIAQAFG